MVIIIIKICVVYLNYPVSETNIILLYSVWYSAHIVKRASWEGVIRIGVRRTAGSPCAGAVCLMLANARPPVAVNHCRTDEFLGCVYLRMFIFIKCVCNTTPLLMMGGVACVCVW